MMSNIVESAFCTLTVRQMLCRPVHRESFLMVSRFFTGIFSVTAMFLVTSSGFAQESLAWKFTNGESLKYVVQQSTQMEMDLNGQKQTMTMNQTMDMAWKIATVESNGNAKMAQVVDRVQFKSEGGPFGSVQFDSSSSEVVDSPLVKSMAEVFKKIVGQEFGVTMQPTGKVQQVTVPPSLLKALTDSGAAGSAMNEDTLKQMMTQSAVTLPAEPIKPGHKWESNQKVELPFGTMTVASVLTYEGTENGLAKISMQPKIDVKPKEGAPITLTMKKSDGKGTVMFDVAKGRIAKSDLDLTMDLQVKQFGTQIQQTLRQKTSMVLAE